MKQLSYQTLSEMGYSGYLLRDAPERVLQFGAGTFLRAFADYFFDVANERAHFNGKVVLVQGVTAGLTERINQQDGLYTLYLRGMDSGTPVVEKRVISAVSRCVNPYANYAAFLACAQNPDLRYIVSNTTEAGIVYQASDRFEDAPQASFPGKLTRFLYERYRQFGTQPGKGFLILSCELIDNNGTALKNCVLRMIENWKLEAGFSAWVEQENTFCSSLVDRIATGYPTREAPAMHAENGYYDTLLNTAEPYALWAIEGDASVAQELPFGNAGLPVMVVPDHTPYKKRKVRILNGAYSALALPAYLCGYDTVSASMDSPAIVRFRDRLIYEEIIPTIDLPKADLLAFAATVIRRYDNPYIEAKLLSISLNTISKWKTRVLPSLKTYLKQTGALPRCLSFSLAGIIAFYRTDKRDAQGLVGVRDGTPYPIHDTETVLSFFQEHAALPAPEIAQAFLSRTDFWDENLTKIPGLAASVADDLRMMEQCGMNQALAAL
ncbi:tagaturonate reductase [uncultured Oscillibacter sp.]|uniref:tagaturonate reductase n=1 Tax=uncultured Oscillibacter sp. TaxID=876091 RepID=UPI002805B653|nr:tagaturonate reductase [uncultured Oscillibacter sp.]